MGADRRCVPRTASVRPDHVARGALAAAFPRGPSADPFCDAGRTRRTRRRCLRDLLHRTFLALHRPRPSTDRSAREQHAGRHRVHARRAVRGTAAATRRRRCGATHPRALRLHRDAGDRAMQVLEQSARLADADRPPEGTRLPRAVHRPEPRVWARRVHQYDAGRLRRLHGRPPATGTREPVAACGFLHRIGKRPVLAGVGGRDAGRHDQRFLASADRIQNALSRDQFPRVQ